MSLKHTPLVRATRAVMPSERSAMVGVSINNKIFVAGGMDSANETPVVKPEI